jgi:hypothetical protein
MATVALAEDELLIQAEKLLEISSSILAEALLAELATESAVADTTEARRCIFLAHLWRAEKFIAQRSRRSFMRRHRGRRSTPSEPSAGSRRSWD